MPTPVTIDFETEAIEFGSGRSPKPVGVSILLPGKDPFYLSWGHPSGNNCTWEEGRKRVASLWNHPLLFQNGKFDIGVAMEHFGLPWPKQWDDTMFLLFLDSPIVGDLGLKPSAHRLLGMPPEEQDAVGAWLRANRVVAPTAKDWGAYISKAPADIVAPYANGDTIRTIKIYEALHKSIYDRGMGPAYEREIALTPYLYESEVKGVRLDRQRLMEDTLRFQAIYAQVGDRIRRLLNAQDIDLDKGGELARAIEASPRAGALKRTPTGRLSTAKDAIEAAVTCPELKACLRYRGALKTLLGTFMEPWLAFSAADGRLHPNWNQVKGTDYGTRTGRLSCSSPNMQNVPTEFDTIDQSYFDVALPFMRRYILPDEGQILVPADYNGQEMRLLAHFAEGRAAEIYRTDPRADFHNVARDILHDEAGIDLKRKPVKIVGFSLIYGAGDDNLAGQLGIPKDEARHLRRMYLKSIPGLKEFQDECGSRDRVRTWGGRIIPVEPPSWDEASGRMRFWNYRLPNHLIQGSAADQIKEAVIRYNRTKLSTSRFLLTVHDENVTSCDPENLAEEVAIQKEAMEKLEGFDVPFVAEVEYGPNWHDLEKYHV